MIKGCKICGIKDFDTLNFLLNHPHPPKFIGFICNYPKSPRYIELNTLKKLLNIKKNKSKFVAVLVKPNNEILEEIKSLPFDYYQLYDCTPDEIKIIKENGYDFYNPKLFVDEFDKPKNKKPIFLFIGKDKEPLFSKKNKKLLSDPLDDNNPITVQVLGICSALAITVQLEPAIVMTMSVIFVMACSNVIISVLRNLIPNRIRIIVFLVVISSLVALVDQFLKAYAYEVSKELSIFIGLIVTNCIIMGRLEAFALGNGIWKSFLDGIGNAFAYGVILILVAFFRELLGSGNLMGVQVIPDFIYEMGYENNGLMLLSPMALITVGIIIWIQRSRNKKLIEQG